MLGGSTIENQIQEYMTAAIQNIHVFLNFGKRPIGKAVAVASEHFNGIKLSFYFMLLSVLASSDRDSRKEYTFGNIIFRVDGRSEQILRKCFGQQPVDIRPHSREHLNDNKIDPESNKALYLLERLGNFCERRLVFKNFLTK